MYIKEWTEVTLKVKRRTSVDDMIETMMKCPYPTLLDKSMYDMEMQVKSRSAVDEEKDKVWSKWCDQVNMYYTSLGMPYTTEFIHNASIERRSLDSDGWMSRSYEDYAVALYIRKK